MNEVGTDGKSGLLEDICLALGHPVIYSGHGCTDSPLGYETFMSLWRGHFHPLIFFIDNQDGTYQELACLLTALHPPSKPPAETSASRIPKLFVQRLFVHVIFCVCMCNK